MHQLIEQDVQKMGMFAYKDFEPEEIDLQINRQIYLLIEGILDKHFGRPLKIDERQGFQSNQVSLDNLRYLTVTNIADAIDIGGGVKYMPLASNYYHHIKTTVTIEWKCWHDGKEVTETKDVAVRLGRTQDDLQNHPFHKTGRDSPLGELQNTVILLYEDGFTIKKGITRYIRHPNIVKYGHDSNGDYNPNLSVHCNLDDSLHYMLVNMTSTKIMELIETNQQKIVNSQRETT